MTKKIVQRERQAGRKKEIREGEKIKSILRAIRRRKELKTLVKKSYRIPIGFSNRISNSIFKKDFQ